MESLKGVGTALVTPLKIDGNIDFPAFEKLINHNINGGISFLVVQGTTGESATLSNAEKQELLTFAVKVINGRVPIVFGHGGSNTKAIIDGYNDWDLTGVTAILSVSPYYNKPSQAGIIAHFEALNEAFKLPIILYNVPGRTSKNMEVETTLRLANDFENVIGVKEAGNNMAQYYELIKNKPEGFLVISGDDDLALGVTLAGGSGAISVIGQAYPKEFSNMIRLGLKGEVKGAYDIHYRLMDVIGYIFEENNPAGIKAVFEALELCKDTVKLPLVPASNQLKDKINSFVRDF